MKQKSYSLYLFLFLFLFPFIGLSATYYSRVSGNWNTASTWSTVSCGGVASAIVPGAGDNVIICAGKTVTMNGAPGSCLSLTINGTANWTSASTTNVGIGGLVMAGGTISGTGGLFGATGKLIVSGTFNVLAGTSTFARGTINVTGISTISGTINWTGTKGTKTFGDLIITSTGNFNNSANEKFTVTGNFQNDGAFTSGTATAVYTFTGTSKTISGASSTSISALKVSGSYTNSATLTITNTFNGAGTFMQGSAGILNLSAAALGVTTFNASAAGNIVNFSMAGNFNIPIPNDGSYSNLHVSSGSTKSLTAATIVGAGLLIATSTTLKTNNFNLKVGGNFINNNMFNAGTGTVTLNGTTAQTISGSTVTFFYNLTVSNSAGIALGINTNVSNVLNFTAGVITTSANIVIISPGGSVTGAGTSKFVNGSLQKNVSTGAAVSRTYEIGSGSTDYLPLSMVYTTVTTAGNVIAKVNNGDDPSVASCCIDDTKSVNRYWQLTNSGVVFTNYSVTCNFIGVPTDADAGSVPANYYMSILNAGVWNLLTPGIRTATSTQSTGVTIMGDLEIGEKRVPVITVQPVNTTVCNNTAASFSITATNAISYQWQQNTGAGFVNLTNGGIYSGVTTVTLSMSIVTNSMNTYQYRCIINSSCGVSSLTSAAATLTVTPNVTASITISASPSTTICAGTNVTFTAVPLNGGTTPFYQWKINGLNVGTNSPTFSSTTLTNGNLVTCVLTSNAVCVLGSPATSNTLTMTVNPSLPVSISISASPSSTICTGGSVTFTATPTNGGATPAYQWKKNGVNIAGATSSTFTSTTLVNGDIITCVLTSSALCATGSPATSAGITMTVNPILPASVSITVSPSSTVCAGTNVTFTATPTNGGTTPTYQWKKNGVNIAGATASTFTSTTLITGNIITCIMTSNATCVSGSPATSGSITMTVNPNLPVSISISATATTICAGTSVTFTATPTNGGTTPAYQWKINGANVGINSTTFTSTTLNNGDLITCVLTSNATCATGNPATSNTITMTVNPNLPVSITISASATTICPGTNVTFTSVITNGGLAPTYQWKKNGINIGGATSSTFSSTTLTNGNIITCVLTSNAVCATGNPATSNSITITVNPALPVSVSITASPSSTSCAGSSVLFTATPVNGGTSPTYQWKKNGVNIVGATAVTFSTTALVTGDIITCVLTAGGITCGAGSPATSNAITMTVNPNLPVSVSIVATATTICAGTSVTFTATPTNGGTIPAYQWKINGVNAGTNSTTFTSTTLNNGDIITCVLTSNATCTTGNPATSGSITMTVNPNLPVSVSIAATATTICSGTSVTFTATPTNGGTTPAYQWKKNGVNIAGATSVTFTSTTLANGDIITCVLTSNATCATGNPATSAGITMTVNPNLPVSLSIVASATTICAGTPVTFTATPTNGGTTPVYQWKLNGVNTGTNSTTYSNSALATGDVITCVLTSNAICAIGNPATSGTITMTVNPNVTPGISISASPSGTICAGTNVTLTATPTNGGTTPAYQWELNGANVGTSSTTYSNSTLNTGDVITCVLTSNAPCTTITTATSNSVNFTVTVSGTWLGTVSSNWNAGANWCGGVPLNTTDVVIPSGTAFSPVLSGNSFCNNMTINAGATFDLNAFSVDVKGNFINNGIFNEGTGTVILDGASAQTISSINPISFYNLTINNASGVALSSGTYNLDGALTVTNGMFNTGSNSFRMTSTPAQTARIAPLPASASIAGAFTVERYITTRDTTYCDLSSPVQNSTFNDWGNELPAISYTSSGSYIRPSAYTYNETSDVYVPVTSSGTTLNTGQGFEVFLSGGFGYADFPATTMNTIGIPNQGDQDFSGLVSNNAQGWNLVGNPFASSISWASIYTASGSASSGLYDYMEMYDYTIADWHGYTSADAIEIGSTQGFWVYGLPGATVLTLKIPESSKTNSINSSIKSLTEVEPYFTLKMFSAKPDNKVSHTFKIAANITYLDGLDNNDLPFRYSLNRATPALYSIIEGKKSNVNSFNSNDDSYSIPLKTEVAENGNYKIEAKGFGFMSDYTCIKLEDRLLNKIIDIRRQNVYSFNMKTFDNPDRFVIHFSKEANCFNESASSKAITDFENEVNIASVEEGNLINFSLSENTPVVIQLLNMLGQELVPSESIVANVETEKVILPVDYRGIYLIRISSQKGTVVKKFYR